MATVIYTTYRNFSGKWRFSNDDDDASQKNGFILP